MVRKRPKESPIEFSKRTPAAKAMSFCAFNGTAEAVPLREANFQQPVKPCCYQAIYGTVNPCPLTKREFSAACEAVTLRGASFSATPEALG